MENSNKALTSPPYWKIKKTKNDLRAMKRILYDMGNFFDANSVQTMRYKAPFPTVPTANAFNPKFPSSSSITTSRASSSTCLFRHRKAVKTT